MGIKALKKHFGIEHIVHKSQGIVFIGSELCTKLFGINEQTGVISHFVDGACKKFYPTLLHADQKTIVDLLKEQDEFEENLICYKCEDGEIVEKLCEKHGFPNVTHDGELMFNNTIFSKREDCVKHSKKELKIDIDYINESITELEKKLAKKKDLLKKKQKELANLNLE